MIQLKVYYAFKIYGKCRSKMSSFRTIELTRIFHYLDYNNDELITEEDIEQTVIALTNKALNEEEMKVVVEKVLEEADNDGDGSISSTEFQNVISRAPEFLR